MKKKTRAKVKKSLTKSKKQKTVKKSPARTLQSRVAQQRRLAPLDDPRVAQAVENYEVGLKAMQEHKYERAKGMLEKVVAGPSRELADRAAMHLSTCVQHLERTTTSFRSPEEHYDYAVSLMNIGEYEGARSHMEKIRKQVPKAEYPVYGLALLDCLTGKMEDALRNLAEAIRLNPGARLQARNDSDFQNLADDPRFTELLYPEEDVEAAQGETPSKER